MPSESAVISCGFCNEPLEPGWTSCPACGNATTSGLLCPNCSREIRAHWKICPYCKTALAGFSTPTQDIPAPGAEASQGFLSVLGAPDLEPRVGRGLELPIEQGDILGERYKVVRSLGAGGFGAVYLVEDSVMSEPCALKVVVAGKGKAERATEQIIHEFKLRHRITDTSHIVGATDPRTAEHKGLSLVLLPMDLAEKGSLRDWYRQNPDPGKRMKAGLDFFRQTCLGVKAIHDAGLVHLDLKPDNVLLVDDKAKITDLDIGRYLGNRFAENPEQFQVARQKDIGPASDIYSLGVILYEILDGSPPFDGSAIELRDKHLHSSPAQLRGPGQSWWGVVERCLRKDPDERYPSVDRLLRDFERVAQGAALSVDVSCPKCGHISEDPWMEVCENCSTSLACRFRPCPRCSGMVRIDKDICHCGNNVGAYYLLQKRIADVEKLEDEDPVEAIELLEVILRENAGEYEQEAVSLVKELRKKQSDISAHIKRATEAFAASEFEDALNEWRRVLKVVPRHRTATDRVAFLESMLKRERQTRKQGEAEGDKAQFDKALATLNTCLEAFPGRARTRQLIDDCYRRAEQYLRAFDRASEASREKRLREAREHVNEALSLAPKSPEALSLRDHVLGDLNRCNDWYHQAVSFLSAAEFPHVAANIEEIESLQADNSELAGLQDNLAESQLDYEKAMAKAGQLRAGRNLVAAADALSAAWQICPDSREAVSQLDDVERELDTCRRSLSNAATHRGSARFDEAAKQLGEIAALCPEYTGLNAAQSELASSKQEYQSKMEESRSFLNRNEFTEAFSACNRALELCPDSREANDLKERIEEDQEAEEQLQLERTRRSRARWSVFKKVTAALGKYGAALALAGGAVYLLWIGGLLFWRWVTSSFWPWCMDSQVELGIAAGILCFLAACVNAARTTNLHISLEFKGVFFGGVVVLGLVVLLSGLVSAFLFHGPAIVGITAGLLIAVTAFFCFLVSSFFAE